MPEWLRVRGMGRERFAGYLEEYLTGAGFRIVRTEGPSGPESRIAAELERMNPAVPASGRRLAFRVVPTSGGSSVHWDEPTEVPTAERTGMDRLMREMLAHVERAVLTESHATAKVARAPEAKPPWLA